MFQETSSILIDTKTFMHLVFISTICYVIMKLPYLKICLIGMWLFASEMKFVCHEAWPLIHNIIILLFVLVELFNDK